MSPDALTNRIIQLLTELGFGFAFAGRRCGDTEVRIDLLFKCARRGRHPLTGAGRWRPCGPCDSLPRRPTSAPYARTHDD
ncbi:hypothetical protein [[Kitasatospora] papulosa]|uniref:hypothetical protein n=1 Tax=[Kitasatospora] papulosa TaxID=1464011 RepID=UPI0038181708